MNAPEKLTAGFAWEWEETFPDFPATTFGLVVLLVLQSSAATKVTLNATANGNAFTVLLPSATSATMTAGTYKVITYATLGSEEYFLSEKTITVAANPTTSTGDQRSHVQKVLDAINAVLEGRAATEYSSITVDGSSVASLTHSQLLDFKQKYEVMYSREKEKERIAAGGKRRNKIIPKFQ